MIVWLLVAKAAIIAVLGALAVFGGSKVVLAVFARVEKAQAAPAASTPPGEEGGAEQAPPPITAAANVLRGGAWIGGLERLAIYASLMVGYPEGIAIVLALKGLARYPELKATTSGAAERFIIGTFVSVLVAAAAAGLARWLTTLF